MAILLAGGTDLVNRNTALPTSSSAYTMCLWYKRTGTPTGTPGFVALINATPDSSMATSNGTTYVAYSQAGANVSTSSHTLNINTWYFVAIRGNSTALTASVIQVGSDVVSSVSTTQSTFTPTNLSFGYNLPGKYSKIRIWNANLSDAELLAERNSLTAVRTTNLLSSHNTIGTTIAAVTTDNSGNGNNFFYSGTAAADAEEPPIGSTGGGGSGTVVSITGGGLVPIVTVQSVTGNPATITASPGVDAPVSFVVRGSDNQIFEGLTVNFAVGSGATLLQNFAVTNAGGVASTAFRTAVAGTYTVVATCIGVSGSVSVNATGAVVPNQQHLVPATTRLSINSDDYRRLVGPGLLPSFTALTGFAGLGVSTPGVETRLSFRLRVPSGKGGTVKNIRFYSPMGSGYASGNGGTMRIRVLPDDNTEAHLPVLSATPMAQGDFSPADVGMSGGNYPSSNDQFQTVTLGAIPKISISDNALIHVFFEEITKSTSNWQSVNVQDHTASLGYPNRWLSPVDSGVILFQGAPSFNGAGTVYETSMEPFDTGMPDGGYYCAPIFQIEMDNGQIWGSTDMETGAYSPANWIRTTGQKICERWVPTQSHTFSGISFRTSANAINSAATIRIVPTAGGAAIMSSTITQATVDYSTVQTFGPGFDSDRLYWRDIAVPSKFSVTQGVSYDVEFEPTAGSWVVAAHLRGDFYGFVAPAAWTESNSLQWNGSSYVNAYHPSSSRADANWDFVFHKEATLVAPPTNDVEDDGFFLFMF